MCSLQPDTDELLERYFRTRDPVLRERIVEKHLYIARIIAKKFSGRGVDYDDLYQVASLALFKAIDRFSPERGIRFASFVTPNMVGEVKNYFRDRSRVIRLPRRGADIAARLRRARSELEQELMRSPRADELARRMGLSEDDVLEAMELSGSVIVPLEAQPEGGESSPLDRFLGEEDAAFAAFEQNDMLERAVERLEERQRAVVRMRFYEGMSQKDTAEYLGVSQMTVSRAERQALEKLREWLGNNG